MSCTCPTIHSSGSGTRKSPGLEHASSGVSMVSKRVALVISAHIAVIYRVEVHGNKIFLILSTKESPMISVHLAVLSNIGLASMEMKDFWTELQRKSPMNLHVDVLKKTSQKYIIVSLCLQISCLTNTKVQFLSLDVEQLVVRFPWSLNIFGNAFLWQFVTYSRELIGSIRENGSKTFLPLKCLNV